MHRANSAAWIRFATEILTTGDSAFHSIYSRGPTGIGGLSLTSFTSPKTRRYFISSSDGNSQDGHEKESNYYVPIGSQILNTDLFQKKTILSYPQEIFDDSGHRFFGNLWKNSRWLILYKERKR